MLCSHCSRGVLPIVAIDIDGTLGQYHEHFLSFACHYFNISLPLGWTGNPENWEDFLGLTRAEYREAKLAYRQGGWKRMMPTYPGARPFMDCVSREKVEIWITTTRPYMRLDSVDPDTQEWLRRHHVPYNHLLYDEHKYLKLGELVDPERVILVVDDLTEMINEARTAFGREVPVQVARTHNQANRITSALSLDTISFVLRQRLKVWEEKHA